LTTVISDLACTQGDTFSFAIAMQANPDGSPVDLTGGSAEWTVSDGLYTGAAVRITKSTISGIIIQQINSVWTISVGLSHADTQSLRGVYYHECKVTFADGGEDHPAAGTFTVRPSANP
jgi:hypothetical protein